MSDLLASVLKSDANKAAITNIETHATTGIKSFAVCVIAKIPCIFIRRLLLCYKAFATIR